MNCVARIALVASLAPVVASAKPTWTDVTTVAGNTITGTLGSGGVTVRLGFTPFFVGVGTGNGTNYWTPNGWWNSAGCTRPIGRDIVAMRWNVGWANDAANGCGGAFQPFRGCGTKPRSG
jgi:hypothetical protein